MTEVAEENLSHSLPFLTIYCFTKLPQMATTCFMSEVTKNGNLKNENGNFY